MTKTDPTRLDVRPLPPPLRHAAIPEVFDKLDESEAFVLVNDHDPKPLYYQFEAEAGPEFRREYRQQGPGEWRVLIAKAVAVEDVQGTDHISQAE